MINRRALLLGGVGMGTLGLTGCLSGLTSDRSHMSYNRIQKYESCYDNSQEDDFRIQWHFNEAVSVILAHNSYQGHFGNFAFVCDDKSQLSFAKLPMSLLNKGYVWNLRVPLVDGDVCAKTPIELVLAHKKLSGLILFSEKELSKSEIALLKKTVGNRLGYLDSEQGTRVGNVFLEKHWQFGGGWQSLNEQWFFDERFHLFGQKLYCIDMQMDNIRLYAHSFNGLFADENEGMLIKFSQKGTKYEQKAEWASRHQLPNALFSVAGQQLTYQGRALNRLDRLKTLDEFERLRKPFGKIDRALEKRLKKDILLKTAELY